MISQKTAIGVFCSNAFWGLIRTRKTHFHQNVNGVFRITVLTYDAQRSGLQKPCSLFNVNAHTHTHTHTYTHTQTQRRAKEKVRMKPVLFDVRVLQKSGVAES